MAGIKGNGKFIEIVSPFLKEKISVLSSKHGVDSAEVRALVKQYIYDPRESHIADYERSRHYQSQVNISWNGRDVLGVERLYRRTILIEPTTVCAAHCRWCLRGQYPVTTLRPDDIVHSAKYIGSNEVRDDVNEVLITGGDPLMSLQLLGLTVAEIERNAPNIQTVRIGTRIPFHDPKRVNDDMLNIFKRHPGLRFEIGINVCHPVEFFDESIVALNKLRDNVDVIYNQNPLLKDVNDNIETLEEFYDILRKYGVEAHYLFHAIPMRGMSHHRTSLKKGIDLTHRLSSSGFFSGRSKPKYAILSDVGKIVIYQDSIINSNALDNTVLIKSGFSYDDRLKWNPSWILPESVIIDENGYMSTWYMDGSD